MRLVEIESDFVNVIAGPLLMTGGRVRCPHNHKDFCPRYSPKHVWNRKYLIVNFTVDLAGIKDNHGSGSHSGCRIAP